MNDEMPKPYWTPGRAVTALLVTIFAVVMVLLYVTSEINKPSDSRRPMPFQKTSDIRPMNSDTKVDCTLFGGCTVNAWCEFQNVGDAPGIGHVEMQLMGNNQTQPKMQRIRLSPGEVERAEATWSIAKTEDAQLRCRVRSEDL